MDEGEIILQGGRITSTSPSTRDTIERKATLKGKAQLLLDETQKQADQGWAIYKEAFTSAISVLPMPNGKDYQLLL